MMKKEEGRGSPSYSSKLNILQENFQQSYLSSGQSLLYCELLIQSLNNKHYQNMEEEYKYKMYSFADEINRIKKGESFCQQINIIMNEREQTIRQLRSQLINSRISKQLNLSATCEKLQSIRMYNLMVIQKVMRLRSELKITESAYYTELLQRVSEDGDFLRVSALKNYIPFSNSKDPLFIVPLNKFWTQLPTEQMQRRPIIDLFNLDSGYQKRLEIADVFLQKMQTKDGSDVPLEDVIQSDISIDQQQNYTKQAIEIKCKVRNTDDISRSTLQKFILPSVNIQKKNASDSHRRNYVQNIIKDVINDQGRDNMQLENTSLPISPKIKKNHLYRSNGKSKGKRVELERSVPRDGHPMQIKYRFDKVHSMINKQRRVVRNQKLPDLNRSMKYPNLNGQNSISYPEENEDVLEDKRHTIDIMDAQDGRVRRKMGKIIKNYSIKTQHGQQQPQRLMDLSRKAESPYRLTDNYQLQSQGRRQQSMPKKIYFNTRQSKPSEGSQRSDDHRTYESRVEPKNQSVNPTSQVSHLRLQNARKADRSNKLERLRESERKRQQTYKNPHHNIIHQYDYIQTNTKNGGQINSKGQNQPIDQKKQSSVKYEIMNQFDIKSVSLSPTNTKGLTKRMYIWNYVIQITVPPPEFINRIQSSPIRQANLRYASSVQNVLPKQGSNNRQLTSSRGSSVVVSPKFVYNNSNSLSQARNIDPTLTFNNSVGKNDYSTAVKQQPSFQNRNQEIRSKTQSINTFEGNQIQKQNNMENKSVREINSNIQVSKFGSANLRREQVVDSSIKSKVDLPFPDNKMQVRSNNALNNIGPVSSHSPSNSIKYQNNAFPNQNVSHSSLNGSNQMMQASQSNVRSQLLQSSQKEGLLNSNVSFSAENQNQERLPNSNKSLVNNRSQQISKMSVPINRQPVNISSVSGREKGLGHQMKKQNEQQRYGEVVDSHQEPINKNMPARSSNSNIKINKNDVFLPGQSKGDIKKDVNYYGEPMNNSNASQSISPVAKTNNNETVLSGQSKLKLKEDAYSNKEPINKSNVSLSNSPSLQINNNPLKLGQTKNEVAKVADTDNKSINQNGAALVNIPSAKNNNNTSIQQQYKIVIKKDVDADKESIYKNHNTHSSTPTTTKINNNNTMIQGQFKEQIREDGNSNKVINNKNSAALSNTPSAKTNNSGLKLGQSKQEMIRDVNADKQPINKSNSPYNTPSAKNNNNTQIERQQKKEAKKDVNASKQSINKSSNPHSPANINSINNNNDTLKVQSKGDHKSIQNIEVVQPKQHIQNRLYKEESELNNPSNTINPSLKQNTLTSNNNSQQQNIVASSKYNSVQNISKPEPKQSSTIRQPEDITKSKITIPNPQTSSNLPVSTNVVQPEQIAITKQQAATLQKCMFQSKSISEQDLLKQIRNLSPSKYDTLLAYLTASFFTHRHINLTNCVFNNQIACYCIYFPQITLDRRLLYILHIEVTQQKLMSMEAQLISTFIKYIFANDPCQRIIYLRHTNLMGEDHRKKCQTLKNYGGQVKTPLKMPFLNQTSLSFQRKGIICKQSEKYTSVINTFGLFVCPAVDKLQFKPAKVKEFNIEGGFLKKMQLQLTSKQAHRFKTKDKLISYLEEQGLPLFDRSELGNNLIYTSFIFQDCLLRTRFLVHSNEFFLTVDPPFSYLLENNKTYFVLISTSESKKFYVFGDKLYEQAQEIDMLKQFREKVMNKCFSSLCNGESGKGQVISCPLFKKQVEVEISPQVHTNFTVELNWKEYIKGVRYLKPEKISLELIPPFFCGMVEIDQSGNIQLLYSCSITEDQTLK